MADATPKPKRALVGLGLALGGLIVGGATTLLASRVVSRPPSAPERQLRLTAGERLSVGRWAMTLKRAALAERPGLRRLVLLIAIAHDGHPAAGGGHYFFLPPDDARTPYRKAVAQATTDGATTRLSFRLPPGEPAGAAPFVLRFAPPDHPSVRLEVLPGRGR